MRTTDLARGPASADAIRVTTNARKRFQTIEGFGASMTEKPPPVALESGVQASLEPNGLVALHW